MTSGYDGATLGPRASVVGPAIIQQECPTIVIEPGWTAQRQARGAGGIARATGRTIA